MGFASRVADRIIFMEAGRIVEEGPPSQVLRDPATERLRYFLSKILQRDTEETAAGRNRDGHLESAP